MPDHEHLCRFYLDIKGKLKPKAIEDICDITTSAISSANPNFKGYIADIHASTSKIHRYDTKKQKKIKAGKLDKSFYVNVTLQGTPRQLDLVLARTLPVLHQALLAAGFKVTQGWGERIRQTNPELDMILDS